MALQTPLCAQVELPFRVPRRIDFAKLPGPEHAERNALTLPSAGAWLAAIQAPVPARRLRLPSERGRDVPALFVSVEESLPYEAYGWLRPVNGSRSAAPEQSRHRKQGSAEVYSEERAGGEWVHGDDFGPLSLYAVAAYCAVLDDACSEAVALGRALEAVGMNHSVRCMTD